MYRRELLATTGSILAVATAGCLGLNQGSNNTPQPDISVEAKFSRENGELVVTHLDGDPIQSGQTIYVTFAGEKLTEKTLNENIYTGGEIFRVSVGKCNLSDGGRVGLYIHRSGNPKELDTGKLGGFLNQPVPDTQIAFDYNSSGSPQLSISHDGGETLNGDNTGELSISGDVSSATWNVGSKSGSTAGSTTIDGSVTAGQEIATIGTTSSGDTVKLVWQHSGHLDCDDSTSQVIGSWTAP